MLVNWAHTQGVVIWWPPWLVGYDSKHKISEGEGTPGLSINGKFDLENDL